MALFTVVCCLLLGYCAGSQTPGQGDPQLFLLMSDIGSRIYRGAIFKLDVHYWNLTKLNIPGVWEPYALDYDTDAGHIYWSDIYYRKKMIGRANLDGSNSVTILRFNSTSKPEGLTIDTTTRELFYTDRGLGVIAKVDLKSTPYTSTTIVSSGLRKPRGIVADSTRRMLYWVDYGKDTIESCDYDGKNRQVIASEGVGSPHGIALDKQASRIFWTDYNGKVSSILENGTNKIVHDKRGTYHFLDVTVINGYIYYTTFNKRHIYATPEDGREIFYLTSIQFRNPGGIHAFSPNLNKDVPCKNGRYGHDCESCGNCKEGDGCEKTTGICIAGCASGYTGFLCNDQCGHGTHGPKCVRNCGMCKNNATCHHQNGTCPDGCEPGYSGPYCKPCPFYTYASDSGTCIPCGVCRRWDKCDSITGRCPNGCSNGWTGPLCNETIPTTPVPCPENTYGEACLACGKCLHGVYCDTVTGQCPHGCAPGYQAPKCTAKCNAYSYGKDCRYRCGDNCKEGTVCDHVTGKCPSGCKSGFSGETCTANTPCPSNTYGKSCQPCGKCAGDASCNNITGQCLLGCEAGWGGDLCELKAGSGVTERQTGGQEENKSALIGGVVGGICLLLLIIIIIGVIFFLKRRRRLDESYAGLDETSVGGSDYSSISSINKAFKMEKF